MSKRTTIEQLQRRRAMIREWLADEAPYTAADQKHLDADTPERAYWHHGYQAALADVLAAIAPTPRQKSSRKGTAN